MNLKTINHFDERRLDIFGVPQLDHVGIRIDRKIADHIRIQPHRYVQPGRKLTILLEIRRAAIGAVSVRTADTDLAGPLAARTVFMPTKNTVTGRLIMINETYLMLPVLCFSACRILHYDLDYLLFCCNTNVKIAQVYRNRRNFTTTCRKIYALFAAHSVKTRHIRIKALNTALFQDKKMSGKNTVIPAAIMVKEILIFY